MKKFMRIALVFALAGAALVGCTKDYSGDISDLNKEVSAIQSTLTSLQTSIQGAQSAADAAAATANTALSAAKAAATADDLKAVQTALAAAATSADLTAVDAKYAAYIPAIKAAATADDLKALETAITAAIAATDVKVADLEKALEAYAKKADLDEAVTRIATLETNYIALEARVAALEAADVEIQKLIDANAKGIETNAKAIEDLQKLVEELTAQVDGNFSVAAVETKTATYASGKWNPGNGKTEKGYFAKLDNAFNNELSAIEKGSKIESFGHLDFIINPSSIELDDTYTFALIGKDGRNREVNLGNPAKGLSSTKAGLNVWNIEVQSPAYSEDGKEITATDGEPNLALVIENANGVYAQTGFEYTVKKGSVESYFTIIGGKIEYIFDGTNAIDAFTTEGTPKAGTQKSLFATDGAPLYDDYFIIEVDEADAIEYDITIEGSEITFGAIPTKMINDPIEFTLTAIGINGVAAQQTAKLYIRSTINTAVELKDQVAELGYKNDSYEKAISYDVNDLGLDALEWKNTFDALKGQKTVALYDKDNALVAAKTNDNPANDVYNEILWFKDADGNATIDYKKATTFGFNIWSNQLEPGTYEVTITDGSLIKAVGSLKVTNPATKPVKLLDALCKDGVLQIVGTTDGTYITYQLENAFVPSSNLYTVDATSFVDEDKANDDESWVVMETGNYKGDFKIKIANATTPSSLFKTREFSATFNWFKNTANTDTIHFKAQAVSPFSDKDGKGSFTVVNPTLEISADATKNSKELNAILTGAKFVAGDNVGDAYSVFDVWTKTDVTTEGKDETFKYYVKATNFYDAPMISTGETATQTAWHDMSINNLVSGSPYVLDKNGDPIEFTSFDTKYLKVLKSNLTIANLTSIQNKARDDDAPVLYLTSNMFNEFAKVWAKYYDVDGTEFSANTAKDAGKSTKIYWAALIEYATLHKDSEWLATYEKFKKAMGNAPLARQVEYYGVAEENIEKLSQIVDTHKDAVELFNMYKDKFRKGNDDGVTEVTDWEVKTVNERNSSIDEVIFAFDDQDLAKKFVNSNTEIKDPYTERTGNVVSVSKDLKFNSGLNEKKLDAHFTIKDAWGHTTTVPVTVTVKPEQK